MTLPKSSKIYVAGHNGLAGGAIWRKLLSKKYSNLIGLTSRQLDLSNRNAVFDFFAHEKPQIVIDAAARVGGIQANNQFPAEFLSENLQIQTNLIDASNHFDVENFLFLGSSCIYPKLAPQPIKEEALLTGLLEPTNDAYAIAKIAGIMQIQASRRQFGRQWISAMPTNLYGPGDNFHPTHSHVLPALMKRIHQAKEDNLSDVIIWGSGKPRREFLFVDDLADACLFLINNYDSSEPINIGVGKDITIRELAELISEVVGFNGEIIQDKTKPDGTPQKLLDVEKINNLGWKAQTSLKAGIEKTYKWFLDNQDYLRSK